jgi:hypothetical protein
MPRWLRITARIVAGLLLILLIAWGGLAWYINTHKQTLLHSITQKLSEETGGILVIRDMQPSLWKSFPNISVVLLDVSLRDSLYAKHRHSLLEVKQLYVKLNSLSLLSGRTEIKKLTASHGALFFYTDATGYSNTYVLGKKKQDGNATKKGKGTIVAAFAMEDVDIKFVNEVKHKLFHIHVRELDGTTVLAKGVYQVRVAAAAHVHNFCFNTARGSFIKDQDLDINIGLSYNPEKKLLYIPEQEIKIGGMPVLYTALFDFIKPPSSFSIRLRTNQIRYQNAVGWVPANIARKLKPFDFKQPIAVDAQITGVMAYKNIPVIRVSYLVHDNVLQSAFGDVSGLSFNGFYFNETTPGNGHGDDNSQLQFRQVHGIWKDIPFTMDTLNVTNLLMPFLNARVRSSFPIAALNDVVGGDAFTFSKGRADADLHYIGGVLPQDTTPYTINGFVKMQDAGLSYLPRRLNFNDVRATVLFKEDNLSFRDVHLRSKSSSITMEGEALHFLRLYFTDPRKITLLWRAHSPLINLSDFLSFAERRSARKPEATVAKPVGRIGTQMNRVLESSTIRLDAKVARLVYKNFTATGVSAHTTLAEQSIILDKAALGHAGGTLMLTGIIDQDAQSNPFNLKADLDKVNVSALLRSFDNFGQDALTANNLQGRLTANAAISGKMTEAAKIIPGSLNGKVTFRLEDGVLDRFGPLEKIGKVIFKKRNLEHVTFKDMHNTLTIAGSRITIPPMTIATSAVNMHVQGVYVIPKGTDIAIAVPLQNPEKEEASTIFGKLLRKRGGIVVNLRARDEDGTGVKITWDPFKKGQKDKPSLTDTTARPAARP